MTIHVVGGVYREYCVHPRWNQVYGSAGRAAMAIARMGSSVKLHSYLDPTTLEVFNGEAVWQSTLSVEPTTVSGVVRFDYLHDMATPRISGRPAAQHAAIELTEERVVRFGMLEGTAVVHAEWAVYDPQNQNSAEPFSSNGSTANHLALVLNSREAATMAGMPNQPPSVTAPAIAATQGAEVVIVKMGPEGAFIWTAQGTAQVPAYRTGNVWKVGSGDCFVAHFAHGWMHDGLAPADAAQSASLATAFYCAEQRLPTRDDLVSCTFPPIVVSQNYALGQRPQVYLAGPFFDLAQVWMVEQAQATLKALGLKVFSPYHDIGLGSADDVVEKDLQGIRDSDMLFAIADGLDAGTIYEIGYARAIGKPVVVYSERQTEENLKMMQGSDCIICTNYTTAMYSALWEAAKL
jgi:nucleoside 2-deoxyribosyltransferase